MSTAPSLASSDSEPAGRSRALVGAGLVFAAFNLRATIAAVAPVLTQVQRSDGLSSAGAGVLTSVPIVCFGAFALATPALLRRTSAHRLLWLAVAGVAAGTVLRSLPGLAALFAGTFLFGAAIGVGNVVLPALIKREFPRHVALLTGLYAMALSAGAALAAGVTVPIEHLAGVSWRLALLCWAGPAVLALVFWSPSGGAQRGRGPAQRGRGPAERGRGGTRAGSGGAQRGSGGAQRGSGGAQRPGVEPHAAPLYRSGLAWAVTAVMGLQSLSFYALFSFVPALLESDGMGGTTAGALLAVSQIASLLAAFVTPTLARRLRRSWWAVGAAVGLNAVALGGLAAHPHGTVPVLVWMLAMGAGQGSILSQALGFIVLRAPNSDQAANLSTMAQGAGYLVAATGPFTVGALHQLTRGWDVPLAVLGAALVVELAAGIVASGDRHVPAAPP